MVALRGGSSNHEAPRLRRLAEELAALLRRRPRRTKRRKPRQVHPRLSAKDHEQLIAEYGAGASMLALAKRWKLHRTTVAEHLRHAGIEVRQRGIPANHLNEAIQLYGEGWSCQRLARRYDCDAETVRQTLKRAKVTLRLPWERI
jgi:DNA-binding CsgD family transcriptional regulator